MPRKINPYEHAKYGLPPLDTITEAEALAALEAHRALRPVRPSPIPNVKSRAWQLWSEAHREWALLLEYLETRYAVMRDGRLKTTKWADEKFVVPRWVHNG